MDSATLAARTRRPFCRRGHCLLSAVLELGVESRVAVLDELHAFARPKMRSYEAQSRPPALAYAFERWLVLVTPAMLRVASAKILERHDVADFH